MYTSNIIVWHSKITYLFYGGTPKYNHYKEYISLLIVVYGTKIFCNQVKIFCNQVNPYLTMQIFVAPY